MELLRGTIRPYGWGSRLAIATIQGRPAPSAEPEAELWLGAHPTAPSSVERADGSISLTDLIAADPARTLGAAVVQRFGARLPYLLKLLAAESPLSLQAHPDAERARQGYAAERVVHGDLAAGTRNYADDSHKPELLVAVTEFEALCGFRDPKTSADVFDALGVPALAPVVDALRTGAEGLREAVRTLLSWPADDRTALVGAVLAATDHESRLPDLALAGRLAGHYPDDPGVLVALLLNHVRLAPGEAVWMPAGNLHAYLCGTGVEIMAASDNVLRGGLTPKRVDVAELLRVLRFEVLDDPVARPVAVAPGVVTWPVPITEFALHRVRLSRRVPRVELSLTGPRTVLCLRGEVIADDGWGAVLVPPGHAAFAHAGGVSHAATPGTPSLTLSGTGEAYVASVPF